MLAKSRRRSIAAIGAVVVSVLLLGWWRLQSMKPPVAVDELLRKSRSALAAGDYESAHAFCQQALAQDPKSVPTLLLAGALAMKSERFEDALKCFLAVPRSNTEDSITALFTAAEVCRAMGRLADAEGHYRAVLERRASHIDAHERLAFILDLQGRRWEATPHLFEQLRQDRVSFSTLIRLGTREAAIPFPDELDKVRRANRDPAAVKLADAVDALAHHQPGTAEPLLRAAISLQPNLVEAHARLGRLLADGDISRVPNWQRCLPPQAELHPDVYVARGLWSQQAGQTRAALRCFWEAASIDPNQRVAQYQLGQLLADAKFADSRADSADRSRLLQRLAALMNQLSLNRSDTSAMLSTSQVLEQLGRYWEAYGWCGLVLVTDPSQDSARERMRALHRRLSPTLPLTDPMANPAAQVDLSAFPLPEWPGANDETLPARPTPDSEQRLQFVDRAAEAGLEFTYFNADEPTAAGTRMYEFAGGGVGALDYDADGLPDLYLTQGCPWPPKVESTVYRDRLFRNLGDGHFQDVTEIAGLGDGWFSQGVAVGDIDNDGWPDLYVANIGRNRLYHNNGDGTFQDITDRAGLSGMQWTTSCLLADLDGDRFPDIYDVNYLKGDDLFDRLCLIGGRRRACVPGVFPAERDRIHLSQGDGGFRELSGKAAHPLDPPRAGMGIVAADMDGSGRLSLFVANDVVANAFLVNETAPDGGPLVLRENALLAGLAFDRDGRAQACMGVAAGDVDGNGLLDLFVTNYYDEANSLYLQTAPGTFAESSRPAGLFDSSFKQLGFGTQFLDGDLDGSLDLVVANGHLDDFRYLDIPFRMRPQLFTNRGHGQFQTATPGTIGGYFDRKLLGRSVAVLDWNRDGRLDFVVSHLETPVALVTNETRGAGHWLKIRLYGVRSSRDAFGSTVTVQCGQRTWKRQLTAGSGYQASNERMLLFGLGESERVDRLTLHWPSGAKQTFDDIQADRELAIIESDGRPLELPSGSR